MWCGEVCVVSFLLLLTDGRVSYKKESHSVPDRCSSAPGVAAGGWVWSEVVKSRSRAVRQSVPRGRLKDLPVCQVGAPQIRSSHDVMSSAEASPMSTDRGE